MKLQSLLFIVLIVAAFWILGYWTVVNVLVSRPPSSADAPTSSTMTPTRTHATETSLEPTALPTHTSESAATVTPISGRGPLQIHPTNPRYFIDGNQDLVYLTGSHTWTNFQERGHTDPPVKLDYEKYLTFMQAHNHNFMRLWVWEHARWHTKWVDFWVEPLPYERTGPGLALDGELKFDLTRFNQDYFDRLRERVIAADERGIYVAVMLFQGFSVDTKSERYQKANPWDGHPFNAANNVNGIAGDANGDGEGWDVHTLATPEVTALQEAYVRKVIDTLNDMDNVLWEISNESRGTSTEWQYHMIEYIKAYEATKPNQHLVGMTAQWPGGTNDVLFDSPADWISPFHEGGYRTDPPAADGNKVVIADTDHYGYEYLLDGGPESQPAWVWKSFTRGMHTLFMDPYLEFQVVRNEPEDGQLDPYWAPIRQALGHTRMYANRIDLADMTPQSRLASSRYCLADPSLDGEYVVYLPAGGDVEVDLSATPGMLTVEWFNPQTGEARVAPPAEGGAVRTFTAPFPVDAVLYLAADTTEAQ